MRFAAVLLLAFALGAVVAVVWLERRASWLSSIDFRVAYPDVPVEVTTAVREAELAYYNSLSQPRRAIEAAQDILTFAAPSVTFAFNFSVGPYRIKAATIDELIPWAMDNGYLQIIDAPASHARQSIAYFAEQPALADWGAAVILERLRRRHPLLRERPWGEIADQPMLVAKLYSGYMGAGGDWALWERDLVPGPEALRRLKLSKGEAQ
ncbi:MAG: hypothetical protein AAF940_02890 [Pseudomonadota bacterium]